MKGKWKGALIGLSLGIFFGWIVPAIKPFLYCSEIHLSVIWSKCNILSSLLLTPKYLTIKLFGFYGMGELLILVILPLIGLLIGFFLAYIIKRSKKNEK